MKVLTLLVALFSTFSSICQTKTTRYIELRGHADALGNIYISPIAIPKRLESKMDTLIDYKAINAIVHKGISPDKVLNALAVEGWALVSVAHIPKDEDGRPNTPFILYYFKRDYSMESVKP